MYYDIERTLDFFPYVSCAILAATLLILEIKIFKEMLVDRPSAEPGRAGFIPPSGGDGYEYYVSNTTIVYIFRKARKAFRIYIIKGPSPIAHMRRDKHGEYFTVRCEDTGTAEKIIDNTFKAITI